MISKIQKMTLYVDVFAFGKCIKKKIIGNELRDPWRDAISILKIFQEHYDMRMSNIHALYMTTSCFLLLMCQETTMWCDSSL